MPRPIEKSLVADRRLIALSCLEQVLLHIADTLHYDPNRPEYHARDISPCSKIWLRVLRHIRRVQHRHRQRDSPHPKHLEDPETKKGEELVTLVVEAVVFAGLNDAEEEEAGETRAPDHDEEGGYDLSRIVVAAECEGDDS